MRLNPTDKQALNSFLLDAFQSTETLESIVSATGRVFADYTTGGNRRHKYAQVVDNAAAENWLDELVEAAFRWLDEDDTENQDALADLAQRIFPPTAAGAPHTHLLTSNMAFVNRDRMRDAVSNVMNTGTPSVLIVKGETLAGASYCWHLVRHVAQEAGDVHTVQIDFDRLAVPLVPEAVMRTIGIKAGFGPVPSRNDLIGSDGEPDEHSPQLVQALSQWFLQKSGEFIAEKGRNIWFVFDNAHRDRIHPATKEMLIQIMNEVGTGQVNGLAIFILGCDTTPPHSFMIEEIEVPKLARTDIRDYLAAAIDARGEPAGGLGNYPTVDEALDDITQDCNFMTANVEQLRAITIQLTSLMRGL